MQNSDLIFTLSTRLDNSTLEQLSRVATIWPTISQHGNNPYFWYKRTETLLGRELRQRPGVDWKSIYQTISRVLNEKLTIPLASTQLGPLSASVMLEAGYDLSAYDYNAIIVSVFNNEWRVLEVFLNEREVPTHILEQAFLEACQFNLSECTKLLLAQHNLDISASQELWTNGLHYAVMYGNLEIYRMIAADQSLNIGFEKNLLFFVACSYISAVEIVADMLADPRIDPTDENERALVSACYNANHEALALLLADGRADPTFDNNLALIASIRHPDCLELLLDDGRADPSADDNRALDRATTQDEYEAVKLLLEDVRVDALESQCFEIACSRGYLEIVKLLIEGEYIMPTNRNMSSGLLDALFSDKVEVARYLLSYPEISLQGLLPYAIQSESAEIIRLLLSDPRIDPRGEDSDAILLAITYNAPASLRVLLQDRRFDPSANKSEALTLAAGSGNLTLVQILLADKRVDARANNNSAIKAAHKQGHQVVVARLQDYGARL